MKEHIVSESTYIPEMGINYPSVPDEHIRKPVYTHEVDVENNYPFLDRSFKARLMNFLIYLGIYVIVFPMHKIKYGLKIEGRKNLRKNRKLLKNGAMTVCNHVYRWDFLAVLQACRFRRMWYPAYAKNLNTKDEGQIRATGGIPIPSTLGATRAFNQAFDKLVSEKKWLHVFPESCRWDWYEPIRPFKKGAFKMAYKYKYPVIPLVITYRKPTGIFKLLGIKHPLTTIHIGEPILPEGKEVQTRNEITEAMLINAHEQMEKMAGITQNCWEAIGE